MQENKPDRQKLDVAGIVYRSVGILMVVLYIALGTTIIFTGGGDVVTMPAGYARVLGIMLILYGIFRGYKTYRRYFSRSDY